MRKMAPGWTGQGAVLMPTSTNAKRESGVGVVAGLNGGSAGQLGDGGEGGEKEERTPLDDLADHLAQLDAMDASRRASTS